MSITRVSLRCITIAENRSLIRSQEKQATSNSITKTTKKISTWTTMLFNNNSIRIRIRIRIIAKIRIRIIAKIRIRIIAKIRISNSSINISSSNNTSSSSINNSSSPCWAENPLKNTHCLKLRRMRRTALTIHWLFELFSVLWNR